MKKILSEMKYLSGYLISGSVILSLLFPEQLAFFAVIFAFAIIPLAEYLLPQSHDNFEDTEEKSLLSNRVYDFMLYLSVPIQWGTILLFCWLIQNNEYNTVQLIGMTLATGISSGVIGINIAHELGHRAKKSEQIMAWSLLLSTLYMHFSVEHNHGHHRYVATPKDSATAKRGQSLYGFWIQSIVGSYISAWKIQIGLLKKHNQSFFSASNLMLIFQILQIVLVASVFIIFGKLAGWLFLGSALIGIILLETINYIEHYGLSRKEIKPGIYEKVLPSHSWNSDYALGRIMLFELTRHADHHYKASRKYQILKSYENSPHLPAGYPAMMLLSTIPPLWFKVMNPRIKADGQGSSNLVSA